MRSRSSLCPDKVWGNRNLSRAPSRKVARRNHARPAKKLFMCLVKVHLSWQAAITPSITPRIDPAIFFPFSPPSVLFIRSCISISHVCRLPSNRTAERQVDRTLAIDASAVREAGQELGIIIPRRTGVAFSLLPCWTRGHLLRYRIGRVSGPCSALRHQRPT